MEKEPNGTKEKSPEELSYADHAKLVNNQIITTEKAINALLKRASAEGKDMYETREKYISQLEKIIRGIG
jgi:hypothetical protein